MLATLIDTQSDNAIVMPTLSVALWAGNIGDALQYLSDDRLKSTYHRVRTPRHNEYKVWSRSALVVTTRHVEL